VVVASPAAVSRLPDGGRFVALDSLRGLAALGVAAFHVQGGGAVFESSLARNGWLLVDFFFVLSGFVIAASYGARLGHGFAVRRFMLLRLGRIYPLHLAILAVYVAMEALQYFLAPAGWSLREPFGEHRSLEALLLALLLLHGFLPDSSYFWNGQSWSIAVEVWLYAAMALAWRLLGPKAWRLALVMAILAALALGLGLADRVVPLSRAMLRGVAGFGLGVACWEVWRARLGGGGAGRGATAAEIAIAVLALAVLNWSAPGEWRFLIADLVFAAVILVFAAERGAVSRLLLRAPFVVLGTLSYSIYMVHPLVLGRGADLLRLLGLGELVLEGGLPVRRIVATPLVADALGLALLTAIMPVAWLSWRWLEDPARRWSRKRAAQMGAAREEASAPTI
jgi:peptidoglycan/LPS O-acetylase OafA/YrhL